MKVCLNNSGTSFWVREWLLLAAAAGFAVSSIFRKTVPAPSVPEGEVLFILFALFVTAKGMERAGLTAFLARRIERGRYVALKLVGITFLIAMFVTNDVALVAMVPVTLSLKTRRKGWLVILEALSANAGSALTPFGNPQNLFLYWFYNLTPGEFFLTIAPFSVPFLGALLLLSLGFRTPPVAGRVSGTLVVNKFWGVYGFFLLLLIGVIFRVFPLWFGLAAVLFAAAVDRKSLAVDYSLLLTFLLFFLFAENLKFILGAHLEHPGHIFILSALLSQLISNVPTALLLAKFTAQWPALLWGVSVGGFGSLTGSLANLIAYRIYVNHDKTRDAAGFTLRFLALGFLAFFSGVALFFWIGPRP